MATLEQIEAALRKADAAGNTEDARRLAAAYKEMKGAQATPQPAAAPTSAQDPYFADLPVPGTIAPAPQPATSTPYDETAAAQGLSGVNEGVASVVGLPVDLTQSALRLGALGLNTYAGTDIQLPVNALGGSGSIKAAMGPAIRPESENGGNQVIRRIGEEVGASLVPGMGIVARSATPIKTAVGQAATALGSGAAAGAVAQVTDNPYAEIAAQILGGGAAVGMLGAGKRAITPFATSTERAAMADTLAAEGVELSPGQITGNKTLRYAEDELGGTDLTDLSERQLEQFTQAALSRAGISAPRATPDVMARAYDDLGDQFDALAARNSITGDQQMVQDIGGTWSEYTSLVNETNRAPIVHNTITDIINALQANGGTITGEAYKAMRSRLGRSLKSATDPELQGALRGLQSSLDDVMERSMTAANSPDLGAWQQVRSDYRNFMVLQNAAAGAGEKAAFGLISPAQLRQAVSTQNKGQYVRGQGDFAELTRAGVAMMSPLANSGTAARLAVRGATSTVPAALGALAGSDLMGGVGAIGGMALGATVPAWLGKAMLSGPGRAYLTNRVAPGALGASEMMAGPALGGLGTNVLRTFALN